MNYTDEHQCFYAMDGPGVDTEDTSAFPIQGSYADYCVNGLFEHEFRYSKFENDRC